MEILCVVILLIAMVIGWSETWEKKERYKRYIYGRLGLESLKVDTLKPILKNITMAKEQMTMEEYLLSQLETPVKLKDGSVALEEDGTPMTKQEAIATNILNQAMKGDVKAASYIQNLQMRAKIMKKM
jgi:hypothetical protein